MIINHQNNVAAFSGNHTWYWPTQPVVQPHARIGASAAAPTGRIMSSLVSFGGLAGHGGIAGHGGGLAG